MISFPNSKINLGLNILCKREDGLHELSTFFYPVALSDSLEIIPHPDTNAGPVFTSSGFAIEGMAADNLCIKAFNLVKNDHPTLPSIKIHLHKSIPMGAGLGGGSADAAFLLKMLNKQFNLLIPAKKLNQYALNLGSDCPFFLVNKPCMATGRGEILEELALDLSHYTLILVNPGIHINTAGAFSLIHPSLPVTGIRDIISGPVESWKGRLKNDFEVPVFNRFPEIKDIRDELYTQGAIYATMSGSGSTVYGIFDKRTTPIKFPGKNYFIKTI